MLPNGGTDLTMTQLQSLAARQQVAMETQQQALVARETRLKYLQQQDARHRQLASEEARLQRMRERVEAQELKLKKLKALRGQAEQHRAHNGQLNSELESVRALFNEKEKELAVAVTRVDTLIKQLHDLKQVKANTAVAHGNKAKGDSKALTLELEKLRNELVRRNQVNTQHSSQLTTQRQLLQQRKDQVVKMDDRIQELQQRLKKRRSQDPSPKPPPPPPPSQKPQQPPLPSQNPQQPPFPLQKPQQPPSDRTDHGWGSRPGQGRKTGPNIAAVEPYIKYPPREVKSADKDTSSQGWKEDSEKQMSSFGTKAPSSMEEGSKQQSVSQTGQEVNNNKSGGDGGGGVEAPVEYKIPSLISSHFDARRGRSGSAGKGGVAAPQVKPGSMGETSDSKVNTNSPRSGLNLLSSPRAGDGTTQPLLSTFSKPSLSPRWPPQTAHNDNGDQASPSSHHAPHHPHVNIFDEERQSGSGQSSPASSEGSGPLVKQGSGVFTHQPLSTNHHTGSDSATRQMSQEGERPPTLPKGQHSGRQAPKPPPRMPNTVLQGPVTAPVSSASSSTTRPTLVDSKPGTAQDVTWNTGKQEGPQTSDTVDGSSASSGEPGHDGKPGSTVHLNQRPAPTYRYASKNTITNTYTGRLSSTAFQRYQQLNHQLYSSSIPHTPANQDPPSDTTPDPNTTSTQSPTDAGDEKSPDNAIMVVTGASPGGMTHFGLVGSPNYPDIASDKGSYKANTPKYIRRRHSDSENEELNKLLQRGNRLDQEQANEENNNQDSSESQPDPPGNTNDQTETPPSPTKQEPDKPQKSLPMAMRQKKPILKGDKRRRSTNRVSFDPLALLLDASLEGELDLVTRTAKEVEDVSTPNDEGITALHNAICAGHYNIVKFLIEFGADVNSPDSDGWTPLHCAASCNNLAMVPFLVEHGACLFATTISDHETAAQKCEEDEDGYDGCSDYLYGVQEKLGIANEGAVYAVFDYTAKNQDELSFHINDKLTILRKGDDSEKEWWWAFGAGNREGYIPRNLLGLCARVLPANYKPLQTSEC